MEHHVSNGSTTAMLPQLPVTLQLHVLSLVSHHDRVLSGRMACKDICNALTGPDHCAASLSQPLPPHAVPWAVEAGQQHARQLPFRHKLQLLCTAAASGSEVNLEVAWALLQPSLFPDLWYASGPLALVYGQIDPGAAAVEAGHPQLLGWLLQHCPGLLDQTCALAAAATQYDLAGLQAAWKLLQRYPNSATLIPGWRPASVTPAVLVAAAGSATPDALVKLEWLMSNGGADCRPDRRVTAAAARSGDLVRLHWLHDRGCPVDGVQVLQCALQHADLAMVQWLVDGAGCKLPAAGSYQGWYVYTAAVSARDAMARLQWLSDRGALSLHEVRDELLADLAYAAVAEGRVDVVRHLRSLPGLTPEQDQRLLQAAFASPFAVQSIPVADYLQRAGMALTPAAYYQAAGSLETVQWLAGQVSSGPSARDLRTLITAWPLDTPAHGRDLLQAVQLIVGQAGCTGWGAQEGAQDDWQPEQPLCAAARRGELALVQYLLQQLPGYQPGGEVLAAAAEGGCEALLEWLVEQHPGCLAGTWAASAYVAPAKSGQQGTLTALRRLGVPWGAEDVAVRAVEAECPGPVLRWLVEQGAPVGNGACLEKAVANAVQRSTQNANVAALLRSLAAAAAGSRQCRP